MVPSSSVDKYLFVECGRGCGGLKKLLPNPAGEETTPFAEGHYVYMEDLRKLGSQMPLPQEPSPLVEVSKVVTPLNVRAWERQLQELPDRECAEFVS